MLVELASWRLDGDCHSMLWDWMMSCNSFRGVGMRRGQLRQRIIFKAFRPNLVLWKFPRIPWPIGFPLSKLMGGRHQQMPKKMRLLESCQCVLCYLLIDGLRGILFFLIGIFLSLAVRRFSWWYWRRPTPVRHHHHKPITLITSGLGWN